MIRFAAFVLAASFAIQAGAATIQFNFGAGFNDNTPVAPVGGNTGTTLGQQRQILFQAAAQIWADQIESSVPIVVEAAFNPLFCDMSGATLGQAGPNGLSTNGALMGGNVFYPPALANALLGSDGAETPRLPLNSIRILDSGSCPGFGGFYYGT